MIIIPTIRRFRRVQYFAGPGGVANKWFEIQAADNDDDPFEVRIYDQIGKSWWDGSGVEANAFV